jgi:hypothetical protein
MPSLDFSWDLMDISDLNLLKASMQSLNGMAGRGNFLISFYQQPWLSRAGEETKGTSLTVG